ncbi:MAG: GTP cyclohydrolase FolE2 [Clostridia bacterium]|jgi:GTP cyclohydrolase I
MLPDIQNCTSSLNQKLDWVGVEGIQLPFKVRMKEGKIQDTIAIIDAYVSLNKDKVGINMSRIPIILHEKLKKNELDSFYLEEILHALKEKLNSEEALVRISFNYFVPKKSPISNNIGYYFAPSSFIGRIQNNNFIIHYLETNIQYTSLCECSKAISDNGAHNQRSVANIIVEYKNNVEKINEIVWIEELIEYVEKCCSCPIYPILKRVDEKYITEQAYNNPKFVETVAREITTLLKKDNRVISYKIKVTHHESIHQHDAVAIVKENWI